MYGLSVLYVSPSAVLSSKVCKSYFYMILAFSIYFYFLPAFELIYFPFIGSLGLLHSHRSQEKNDRLFRWHGCPHVYSSLVLPVESFNPVSRVYAPLHLFREVHIGEVCHVSVSLVFPKGRILLFPSAHKVNKMFVSPQGIYSVIFHREYF